METQKRDKRKVLLIAPMIILAFLAFTFYAMGGGKGNEVQKRANDQAGINSSLPDANFKKEEPKNKMELYERSQIDSTTVAQNNIREVADRLGFNGVQEDPQTVAINQKLEALDREISKPTEPKISPKVQGHASDRETTIKNDVDRLEKLMKTMQENKEKDPEMQQLDGMLQNILDIQHPQRVQERMAPKNGATSDSLFKAIPAVIVDNQRAVQGATIKIRLQDSIRINGIFIPKGHDLYGICRITNQRLLLDIKNIRMGTSIIPVDLSVYSLDGMQGVYAPEALLADAVNNGTSDAIGNIGVTGFDLTTQVAGAGLEAAKGLLNKKIKRIKVKLDAGRPILLRNNKPKTY